MKPALQGYETMTEAVPAPQPRKPVPQVGIGGCGGDGRPRPREAFRSLPPEGLPSPVLLNNHKVLYEDFLL